jgi:hypothetical protein
MEKHAQLADFFLFVKSLKVVWLNKTKEFVIASPTFSKD